MKDQEIKKLIGGYRALFEATSNPVFATAFLYMQRTENKILLPAIEAKTENELNL